MIANWESCKTKILLTENSEFMERSSQLYSGLSSRDSPTLNTFKNILDAHWAEKMFDIPNLN